ncbi:MAG: glycoside hydrolase family 99-like domain-containing protein [Phycisphaerae bacterium]|nr:glycoside hydrolase family 99-like domain-containing protein [Phycisphaerae bacterium]
MNFKIPPIESKLDITGERFVTQWSGQIKLEHYHRYLFAAGYCKNKTVLDIASGEGYGSFLLSQTARRVCGVDIDSQSVEFANEKYRDEKLSFHVGNCEWIPFEDKYFDVVVSFETLEHISQNQQLTFFKEIRRVLRPGGLLIMSTPDKNVYDVFSPNNPFHVHEITQNKFCGLVANHFKNYKILTQNFLIGSYVQGDDETALDFFEVNDQQQILHKDKLECLEYLICVASDAPLSKVSSGLFLDTYYDSVKKAHLSLPGGHAANLEQYRSHLEEQNKILQDDKQTLLDQQKRLHDQCEQLRQENSLLEQQKTHWQDVNHVLKQENSRIISSRSWRCTRPLRFLMAMIRMDKRYLYDAAQQVRNTVWVLRQSAKVRTPRISAYVVEPFLGTLKKFFKPLLRNLMYRVLGYSEGLVQLEHLPYESDYQDNQDFTVFSTDIKAIAFYLPQFHQIPENDEWWGEGFTEWTNTKRAQPLFVGHYQPREPHADFGHYDLSDIETLKKQATLARQHGIYGFCFHHYYFHGKRLLEKPVDMLLEHPEININFCLCWANESWTKKWDGAEHEILIAQEHSPQDDVNFIRDMVRYIHDPRYIKSDGRPVIMVYRPLLLPDPKATFERWRQYCRQNGIGGIAIWGVRGCFNQETGLGLEDCTEAEVEFPPHLTAPFQWIPSSSVQHNQLKLPLVDYKALVKSIISRKAVAEKLPYPVYRTAMLGWDNTARRNEMGYVFYGFSIRRYYEWLRYIIEDARRKFSPAERFIFINAWNEWAEGTYLEPDKKHGYANINTTSKALFDLPFRLKCFSKVRQRKNTSSLKLVELVTRAEAALHPGNVAVHAHIFYPELTDELTFYMNNIPVDFDCYITTDTEAKKEEISNKILGRLNARRTEIRVTPNVGRDVAPFLVGCRDIMNRYDYICHIHTKKSVHNRIGEPWREHLLDHLLGSRRLVRGILDYFEKHPEIGLIYPPVFSSVEELAVWGGNVENVQLILRRIGAQMELPEVPRFPVGTMIWMRTKAFSNLFEAGFTYEDFEEETGQLDGTLAHAFERSLTYIVDHNGYSSLSMAGE